mmetsp:Transcript_59223/g.132834  ORF Transcript_59223/g.132834 Transcript_59223/m.132834 type:complete len:771 (+) Transcript_59223:64-2376(+)
MGQDLATQAGSTSVQPQQSAGSAYKGSTANRRPQQARGSMAEPAPYGPQASNNIMSYFRSRQLEEVCELDKSAKPLGKGAFGIVLKAYRKGNREVLAVKTMDKERIRQMKVEPKVIYNEVALMRECSGQDRFVQLFDFIDSSSKYYLIMELCDGNLQDGAQEGDGCLVETQVQLLMKQMLQAVAYLHSKDICHRDVKPHNYMLRGRCRSDRVQVKLGDFGIATRLQAGKLLKDQMGTPAFMAPELHLLPKKSKGYDHKVDLWAVGVCMVFLLANEYPFIDNGGRLLRDKLIAGDMPVWDASGFASLFQRFQEATGLARRRPSRAGQELTRQLLQPRREKRPSAAEALRHVWFQRNPLAEEPVAASPSRAMLAAPLDDRPLLDWNEFEQGFAVLQKDLEKELARMAAGVAQMGDGVVSVVSWVPVSVDAMHGRPAMDRNDERLHSCVVCYMAAGDFAYVCPQCRHTVCMNCLSKLPRAMCPHCRHEAPDIAMSQWAANVMGFEGPDFNNLVDIDMPNMHVPVSMSHPVDDDYRRQEAREACLMCKEPAGITSYASPCCRSCLCFACAKQLLFVQECCPTCGDNQQFTPSLRHYLATGDAVTNFVGASMEMGRSLSDGAKKLSQQWFGPGQDMPPPTHDRRPMRSMTAPDMGTSHGQALSHQCTFCKVPGAMMDHVCPRCRHTVCMRCIREHLSNDLRCPTCGDVQSNQQSMRMLLHASSVQSSAQAVWGGISSFFGAPPHRACPPPPPDREDRYLFRGALDTQFSSRGSRG